MMPHAWMFLLPKGKARNATYKHYLLLGELGFIYVLELVHISYSYS